MSLGPKSFFRWLSNFLSKVPGFSRPDKHSIHFLNIAQFMGVLNDNIFKLVISFLLIAILGQQYASTIMAVSGAVFVIPFLLFSSTAGMLADRFSKQRLMMMMKVVEIIIMLLAMVAFSFKSVWASYTLLFILASHSAMFGPSKYAIISELVPQEKVSRANGLITSFTYFGVIVGTFLASFLTQITGRNFVIVAAFGLLIAVIGFIATFGIRRTPAQQSSKKPNWLFISEIVTTLKFCKTRKHLLVAMCGSAYFLFIGAFAQLNIIPFAIYSLNMTDIAGGYLFLCTAIGIAIGAFVGGRASKTRVELGLSCFAGIFIAIFLFLLTYCCTDVFTVISLLFFLGICGGLFIVPFDSFVQLYSPNEKRGQIIGANNFLSFCGVLVASLALFIFSDVLGLTPAAGFGMIGIMTLFLSLLMISRLSDLALPFIARRILKPFTEVKVENIELLEKNPNAILILRNATWTKAFLLISVAPNVHLLVRQAVRKRFPWFNWMLYSVHLVPSDESYAPLLESAKLFAGDSINPCIMVESDTLPEVLEPTSRLLSLFKGGTDAFLYVDVTSIKSVTAISFRKK
jgi:acyl-[acyl-carrier-protein]-phospholipid O-acyltransferase / long-chain-fatty-acid--[acyl-carrier-protein] ligase